jgi:glycine cleavage system H protein
MEVPSELRYTNDHEWVKREGDRVRVGITDFAQDALGDIVFVDLPAASAKVEKGGQLAEVESTKSVSEVYAPVSGTVLEVNDDLRQSPEKINGEPYGSGWLALIEPSDPSELEELLDAEAYRALSE